MKDRKRDPEQREYYNHHCYQVGFQSDAKKGVEKKIPYVLVSCYAMYTKIFFKAIGEKKKEK